MNKEEARIIASNLLKGDVNSKEDIPTSLKKEIESIVDLLNEETSETLVELTYKLTGRLERFATSVKHIVNHKLREERKRLDPSSPKRQIKSEERKYYKKEIAEELGVSTQMVGKYLKKYEGRILVSRPTPNKTHLTESQLKILKSILGK